jgi:hypothetical protein
MQSQAAILYELGLMESMFVSTEEQVEEEYIYVVKTKDEDEADEWGGRIND